MPQAETASVTRQVSAILASMMVGKSAMLTDEVAGMDEAEFARMADRELAHLESALEEYDDAFDLDPQPGGVLELEFEDGSKVVVNRHLAAREIWVAARSGGFHFGPKGGQWVSGRDGVELYELLDRVLSEQSGAAVRLTRRSA